MVRVPEEDATFVKRECGPDVLAELTAWAREAGAGELSLPRPLWSVPGKGYTGAVLLAVEVAPPARVVVVKVLPKGPSARGKPPCAGRGPPCPTSPDGIWSDSRTIHAPCPTAGP